MRRSVSAHAYLTLFTAAAGLTVTGFSRHAAACSCAIESGFYSTVPADGAADVPTDVALLVSLGDYTAEVILQDEQGNPVPTTRNYLSDFSSICGSHYELVPTAALLPQHNYRLVTQSFSEDVFESELPEVVSFTTGTDPATKEATPSPTVELAVFTTQSIDSCTESAMQACLVGAAGQMLELHVESEEATRRFVEKSRATNHFALGDLEGEVCISVHTRDLAGNLSEPFEQCFQAGEVYQLQGDDDDVIYAPCESEEVQALLRGEVPNPKDAGPTALPPAAEDGGMSHSTPSDDGGVWTVDDTINGTGDTGLDTREEPTSPADAGPLTATSNGGDVGEDSGRPGTQSPVRENDILEKNPISPDSEDSGCSVATSRTRPFPSLALLGAALVFARRRLTRRK